MRKVDLVVDVSSFSDLVLIPKAVLCAIWKKATELLNSFVNLQEAVLKIKCKEHIQFKSSFSSLKKEVSLCVTMEVIKCVFTLIIHSHRIW